MRYTDHLWILSVCFSFLMAIILSLSTDHLWMWLRKSSQTNFVCADYFVSSQMNFVCDEEKHHKDGKSTQTTSTDHLWISSVHTIRIGLTGWQDIHHCVAAQCRIRAIHPQPYPIMHIPRVKCGNRVRLGSDCGASGPF